MADSATIALVRGYHLLAAAEYKTAKNGKDNLAERYIFGVTEEIHELAEHVCKPQLSFTHTMWQELFDVFGYVELVTRARPDSSAMRLLKAHLVVAIDTWVATKIQRGQDHELSGTVQFLLGFKRRAGGVP